MLLSADCMTWKVFVQATFLQALLTLLKAYRFTSDATSQSHTHAKQTHLHLNYTRSTALVLQTTAGENGWGQSLVPTLFFVCLYLSCLV